VTLARLLPFALLPALLFPVARPAAGRTLWTVPGGATVYAAPRFDARVLTSLPDNQPLRVTTTTPATTPAWGRTRRWNALDVYAPLSGPQDHPTPSVADAGAAAPLQRAPYGGARATAPLAARGLTRVPAYLRALPAFGAPRLALLPRRAALTVDAWATDAAGAAWYHIAALPALPALPAITTPATGTAGVSATAAAPGVPAGWVYGDAMTFDAGTPVSPTALLAPLRGKGMWFTYPLLQTSPVTAIIATARVAGLSHLYVEVGRSNKCFYGGPGLAALLPAAHRAGIRVIAWVYPFLRDLSGDIAMGLAAARYTAPSGDRPDGLLADVEENTNEAAVRAYGQVLRATLGPDATMAIATYPPQWADGRAYPFATAALSWNAIVPMDYWHLRRRAYSAAEVYAFVRDSVVMIRARTRPDMPVEVLGQMFDLQQSGVNSPGAAEILACAAAARDSGALGVSFFEWRHATREEWDTLTRLSVVGSQ